MVSEKWNESQEKLILSEYKAKHDLMTGLWNKTSGLEQIEEYLKNMSAKDMAVLGFADIDNFKQVNDDYGHEAGDYWIREIATMLQTVCNPDDIVCRYGGDEYIIFLKEVQDIEELKVRMDRVKNCIHNKAIEKHQDVHCSIGFYQVKGSGKTLQECIEGADALLYQAKKNGKNIYSIG